MADGRPGRRGGRQLTAQPLNGAGYGIPSNRCFLIARRPKKKSTSGWLVFARAQTLGELEETRKQQIVFMVAAIGVQFSDRSRTLVPTFS